VEAGNTVQDWASIAVALAALGFTVGSFWWMNWRVGSLTVPGAPSSFAGTTQNGRLILLFPLVFYNSGPVPYVVRDLRLRFGDEPDGPPLSYHRVRSGISPSHSELEDLSAAFPVGGNEAVRMFCEFERTPIGREMTAGRHPLILEALTDKRSAWQSLLSFDLHLTLNAEVAMPSTFISFRNREEGDPDVGPHPAPQGESAV
jgi:hypothetical protein